MTGEMIRFTIAAGPGHRPAVRAAAAGTATGDRFMSGPVATYGKTVQPYGPWSRVQLAHGALDVPDDPSGVKLLAAHGDGLFDVIGSMSDAPSADGDTLSGTFRLANTSAANDAHSLVRDGHVDGFSVGYYVRDGHEIVEDGQDVFLVTQADLVEVSVVPYPADSSARIAEVTAQRGSTMTTVTEPQDRGVVEVGPDDRRMAEEISTAVRAALAEIAPQYAAPAIPPTAPASVRAADAVTADGYGRFLPGYTTRDGQHVTAGDYFSALMRMRDGDGTAYARIAAANDLTTDVPGLLPVQIMQPIIDTLSDIRPVFDSLSLRVMPASGSKFQRPTIGDHVAVGEQATELTAVASQAMTVELTDVAKRTIAGALKLSVQSLDWSSPALLDLVISDFAKVYAKWTEADISTRFAGDATGTAVPVPIANRSTALNAAFYEATSASWTAGGIMPNRVWLSLDSWAAIGSQADDNGRPLYPYFGSAVNAHGSLSPAGMLSGGGETGSYRPVVGPYLPAGTILVGPSAYEEVYEDRRGMLRAADPSALGQSIGFYGYVANFTSVPTAFVPITLTAPAPSAAKSGA